MNVKIQLSLFSLTILLMTLVLALPGSLAQDFPDVCQQGENILRNCNFSEGLNYWQTFTEAGGADVTVLQGGGGCHAPLCPAAYIVTNDQFVGGIYQQVPVTKGANYYANIVWLVFDSLANDPSINSVVGGIGRRIGIDPYGGTDSRSPNVVWSEDNWRNDCKICNVEQVTVTAQADTITVFLRLEDTWRARAAEKGYGVPPSKDQFWIDDLGLKQVGGDPIPAQVEPPTDTPAPPPTDTPVSPTEAPTSTPAVATSTPTPAATEVAQNDVPEPVSPVETPTPTNTPVPPPPTLTPTSTPSPTNTALPRPTRTATRLRRITPTPQAASVPFLVEAAGTTVCVSGVGLLLAAVVIFGLVWLYRLGWGQGRDEEK